MSIMHFLSSRLLLCNLLASTAATNPLDKPSRGNNNSNGSTHITNLFQHHDAYDSVGVLGTTKNLFELSQTSASAVVSLTNVGNNGSPAEAFPLGECEGDCDNDSECSGDLVCFQRSELEPVPGCSGEGTSGTDYCAYRPPNGLWRMGDNGSPSAAFPLGLCEGDCDSDSDCVAGLKCLQRSGDETVPGCDGSTGTSGEDYCYSTTQAPTSMSPTASPTKSPRPTRRWSKQQKARRTPRPTPQPFRRGELTVDVSSLGIKLSTGMSVRVVARANEKVQFSNGNLSSIPFHSMPDGAAVFTLSNGRGYVYVSNAEVTDYQGGVYAVYFDVYGRVYDYKELLSGTKRNCSGGKTPWGTWVSCEEHSTGQCWQVHPDPEDEHHDNPEMTVIGEDGGPFESVACDDSDPSKPVFFLTEDAADGALRRYRPNNSTGWSTLHEKDSGAFDYLEFLDNNSFRWTTDINAARSSQETHFPNLEGIDYYNGTLYFVSKKEYLMYILDLEKFTYTTTSTKDSLFGDGEFTNQPDQIIRGKGGEVIYFTEDGGNTVGVYAIDKNNERYAIFEAYSSLYDGDETTGLAFSPDGTKMYACFQDCGCNGAGVDLTCGCLLEFARLDGGSFHGSTLSLKFHGAS